MRKLHLRLIDWAVYILIAIGVVFGLWYFLARPAKAEGSWPPSRSCEWRGDCRRYYAQRHRPRVYNYIYRLPEPGPECRESIAVTGDEKYGTARAKESADATWAERAKYLFGVRYMDLKNARNSTYECGRSSTGKRASEAVAGAAGQSLEQCELRARPCRAEREKGE